MSGAPNSNRILQDRYFGIASWLLLSGCRAPALAFYRLVRHAHDIADDAELRSEEKLLRLDALGAGLANGRGGPPEARALHNALAGRSALVQPAMMMLDACRQDACGKLYESWSDLVLYCSYSAVPAGRFLLALCHEADEAKRPADALATAHRILSLLRNCGEDYRRSDRVYIPTALLPDRELLGAHRAGPALRAALNACLDRVDLMLAMAAVLPDRVRHRGLAAMAAMVLSLDCRLAQQLRRHDPLAEQVRLDRFDLAIAGIEALRHRFRQESAR